MTAWPDTRRQHADLLLTGGRIIVGDIHLQMLAENHSGPESPLDLLNRAEPFFAVTVQEGQPILLSKSQLLMASLAAEPPIVDPARESAALHLELEVELSDGSVADGQVMLELPPTRNRVLDFLNFAPGFFAIWTPRAVRLINRDHVRAVSPLSQVSRAAT